MPGKQWLVLALTLAVTSLNELAYAKGSVTHAEARMYHKKIGALVDILRVRHADGPPLPCRENNLALLSNETIGRQRFRVVASCYEGVNRTVLLTDEDLTSEFVVTEGLDVGYDIFYKPALPNPLVSWRAVVESLAQVHSSDILEAVRRANILIAQRRLDRALERLRQNLANGMLKPS